MLGRLLLALTLSFSTVTTLPADEWSVLPEDGAHGQMLERYLHHIANVAIDRRTERYEELKTPEQIAAYQNRLQEFFWQQLGTMPERTPLNAKVVGNLELASVRVEKIVFESRPHHYVTGLMYLPTSKPPYPGVLVPCGHSANGKAAGAYQQACILLAQHGIAAFCYDPIGQGERYQILDAQGKPEFKSTTEHTLVGVGSILVGRNTAHYRVWDGLRAMDYLASRPEVDAEKLGCTGNSGGGTMTEYLMALDERIVCAAPSCCVTTFRRRLATIGPGDAEQNIFGQIAYGLDHADYTLIRAPQPTLLCTATQDFVDIQGSWDIFREAKRLYTRQGYAERVDLIEVDAKHGFSKPLREGVTRWMKRWLLGVDEPVFEEEFPLLSERQATCTKSGQVQTLPGAVSVMDLNLAHAEACAPARVALWQAENRPHALDKVRELAGIRELDQLPALGVHDYGQVKHGKHRVGKLALEWPTKDEEPAIVLPALHFLPEKPSTRKVLLLDGDGKAAALAEDGPLTRLLNDGAEVLAVDLRGTGETGPSSQNQWGGSWDDFFVSYLLGKSLLGQRTEDALLAAHYLGSPSVSRKPTKVEIMGIGTAAPVALHAAALEPQLFAKLTLKDAATTWLTAIAQPGTPGQMVNAVHGALEHYDLADLIESLPQDFVVIEK